MTINAYMGFDIRAITTGTAYGMTIKRAGEATKTVSATAIATQGADNVFLFVHGKSIEGCVNQAAAYPYNNIYSNITFGSALAIAMTSACDGWGGTPIFTAPFVSGKYSISVSDSSAFDIEWDNAVSRALLGWTNDVDSTSTYAAPNYPYFYIESTLSELSDVSDIYESGGMAAVAMSDTGIPQEAISRTAGVLNLDFTLQFEPLAKTFIHAYEATRPWTYESLFAHCRCNYPVLFDNTHFEDAPAPIITGEPVCLLRPDGSSFRPIRGAPGYDGYWHIPFNTYMVGWK